MSTLCKSILVEVLGGHTRMVIESGTVIPTTKTEVFSTSDDNQHAIALHVLRGDAQMASANETHANYLIHEVPEGSKGTARIEVRFTVDINQNLDLTAFVQHSGKELPVRIR